MPLFQIRRNTYSVTILFAGNPALIKPSPGLWATFSDLSHFLAFTPTSHLCSVYYRGLNLGLHNMLIKCSVAEICLQSLALFVQIQPLLAQGLCPFFGLLIQSSLLSNHLFRPQFPLPPRGFP